MAITIIKKKKKEEEIKLIEFLHEDKKLLKKYEQFKKEVEAYNMSLLGFKSKETVRSREVLLTELNTFKEESKKWVDAKEEARKLKESMKYVGDRKEMFMGGWEFPKTTLTESEVESIWTTTSTPKTFYEVDSGKIFHRVKMNYKGLTFVGGVVVTEMVKKGVETQEWDEYFCPDRGRQLEIHRSYVAHPIEVERWEIKELSELPDGFSPIGENKLKEGIADNISNENQRLKNYVLSSREYRNIDDRVYAFNSKIRYTQYLTPSEWEDFNKEEKELRALLKEGVKYES